MSKQRNLTQTLGKRLATLRGLNSSDQLFKDRSALRARQCAYESRRLTHYVARSLFFELSLGFLSFHLMKPHLLVIFFFKFASSCGLLHAHCLGYVSLNSQLVLFSHGSLPTKDLETALTWNSMLTEYTHFHWNGRLVEPRNPPPSFYSPQNGTRKRGLRDTMTSSLLLFHVKT